MKLIKNKLVISLGNDYSINFPRPAEFYFQQEWNQQLIKAKKRNTLLFNGPLFHVANWENKENIVYLKLGLTDYKSYVCSRTKEFRRKFPEVPQSMPLALCITLITSDRKLIVEQRKGVDIYNDFFHVPGGFLDPVKDLDQKGIPEPFKGIDREVKEEVGLELDINNIIFLGLAEDTIIPHYELCFLSEIDLSSVEVLTVFNEMKTDGEFNHPIFIDFNKESINSFLEDNNEKFSPTGRDCLIMAVNFRTQ